MFKIITYPKILFDTLRSYFSVNAAGNLSIMYKYCLAILIILQAPFDAYDRFRIASNKLANCAYTIGQLTNQLNDIFDYTLRRITITQGIILTVFAPNINEGQSTLFCPNIDEGESIIFVPNINDIIYQSQATFNIPAVLNPASVNSINAMINNVKLDGLTYKLNFV